ncbi:MAG: 50S ribosomal protein L23 [Bacteroidales bacterium]|jgi:large subunit ribosomal protein L23|nr:50S ribosomal protein L23 [Bacteroidales bacterium]
MEIIVKPLISERMTRTTEKMPNRCGFVVDKRANKYQIKNAVEALYNVKVVDVNTMNYSGKVKSRYTKAGFITGKKPAYKKAIVTLAKDNTIDFYSNI